MIGLLLRSQGLVRVCALTQAHCILNTKDLPLHTTSIIFFNLKRNQTVKVDIQRQISGYLPHSQFKQWCQATRSSPPCTSAAYICQQRVFRMLHTGINVRSMALYPDITPIGDILNPVSAKCEEQVNHDFIQQMTDYLSSNKKTVRINILWGRI